MLSYAASFPWVLVARDLPGEGDREPTRHRLDLVGNRTVNSVLYIMSVTQSRYHSQPATTWPVNVRGPQLEGSPPRPQDSARPTRHPTHVGRPPDNLSIQHPKLPKHVPLDKGASGMCVTTEGC